MLDINKARYIDVIVKVTRLDRLFVSRLIYRMFNPGAGRWPWPMGCAPQVRGHHPEV